MMMMTTMMISQMLPARDQQVGGGGQAVPGARIHQGTRSNQFQSSEKWDGEKCNSTTSVGSHEKGGGVFQKRITKANLFVGSDVYNTFSLEVHSTI